MKRIASAFLSLISVMPAGIASVLADSGGSSFEALDIDRSAERIVGYSLVALICLAALVFIIISLKKKKKK